ncbi:hypothetical protein L798_01584 [Zootermopsis nevadensis]|uniref:Uncharacterized protein n=1 Tax=Zootermopsis nevadensis TaxID=136037 RepID=A0A067QL36_ZOONE|nr:hypothetical protein L798_01584 [Zootermopsis nevadensis]
MALPNTSYKFGHRRESNPVPQDYKSSVLTARPPWQCNKFTKPGKGMMSKETSSR